MRMRKLLLIAVALFVGLHIQAQYKVNHEDAQTILEKRKEIFFKFKADESKSLRKEAGAIVSVDEIGDDGWVYAYANANEFKRFRKLDLAYQLLYNPSELSDPEMWSPEMKSTYDWDEYPTYEGYVDIMEQFEADYPDLCQVESIGETVEGRELLVAKISDNPDEDENEPEFFYTSTMHGDETAGYVSMLRYIDYLLTNYGTIDRITNLVDGMEIYINPNANPDGTYATGNSSVSGATRNNANGVDLNRNFRSPETLHPDGNAWQPETVAFMDFAEAHDFVMSANFHGGAEVVNYPWDIWEERHADDEWFQFISHEYADTAQLHSPPDYMDGFNDGITNGYDWYSTEGNRQDYMNYFHRCRETTIEISDVKLIPESELENHWEYNYRSFLNYMEQATYGIQGVVTDAETGNPVEAHIFIDGHDEEHSSVFSSMPLGNYYRPIEEGTFDLTFDSECHEEVTIENISVENYQTVVQDVELTSLGFSAQFSAASTNVQIGTDVQFNDESCGNPTSWEWTFEGGTPETSTEQNPVVVYEDPGTYDVTLTVSNAEDEETLVKEDYITASAQFNMADETVTTCQGLFYDEGGPDNNYPDDSDHTMTFYPEGSGALQVVFESFSVEEDSDCSYDWLKIYDGESTSDDLIGTYCGNDSPGTITATNDEGALTFEFHSDGLVNESGWEAVISCEGGALPPEADFEADQTTIVEGESVSFTDLSTNNPTSWSWSFEGGTPESSDEQNPVVTYNEPGEYSVALVATNEGGSDTETKDAYITVGVNTASGVRNPADAVRVFPNPNKGGKLTIQAPFKMAKLQLIAVSGSVVKSVKPDAAEYIINTSGLQPGVYILRILNKGNAISKKVHIMK